MRPAETIPPSSPFAAPVLGADGRILEGIVTTLNADGLPNIAPMGPIVDDNMERLWLRPFRTSTTFVNLQRHGEGVFHITDDVELFAQAAVGQPTPAPRLTAAAQVKGFILADACRWYAFRIESLDDTHERASVVGRIVDCGEARKFIGFNRAKHAVVEAAILATRVHLTSASELETELLQLKAIVEKTGAAAEHRAFEFLSEYVRRAISIAATEHTALKEAPR